MSLVTIVRLTFLDAARRRILLAALIVGAAFLLVYAIGLHFIAQNAARHASAFEKRMVLTFFVLAGLYAVNFLILVTAALLPVDTLSGEIASGVMQTVASKPVRRSVIVLGKWLGHALLLTGFFVLLAGGQLLVARWVGHVLPPHLERGLPLMLLDGWIVLTVSIWGGTRFSTIANGMVVFGLYAVSFLGGWVEQIGTLAGNDAARRLGTLASLLMPGEALWQLAASRMQPTLMLELHVTPFSPASIPSPAMVYWAVGYLMVFLLAAVARFRTREL